MFVFVASSADKNENRIAPPCLALGKLIQHDGCGRQTGCANQPKQPEHEHLGAIARNKKERALDEYGKGIVNTWTRSPGV